LSQTKKRARKKSGSGSESETGSVSDTDEEDTTAVNSEQFDSETNAHALCFAMLCCILKCVIYDIMELFCWL